MDDAATSFDDAWERFQARDSLRLMGDTLEWEWTRGRAQYLAFLVRVEDSGAREHLAQVAERLARIPSVEPYPDWYWHITVKGPASRSSSAPMRTTYCGRTCRTYRERRGRSCPERRPSRCS